MSNKQQLSTSHLDQLQTTGAGYDILRYVSLPELLGEESNTILYFMGRSLARKLEINQLEDVYNIFNRLGWGQLELVKEKKNEWVFHLMDDTVALRLKSPLNTDFRLEAGFIAEAVQHVKGGNCECLEKVNERIFRVDFSAVFTKDT